MFDNATLTLIFNLSYQLNLLVSSWIVDYQFIKEVELCTFVVGKCLVILSQIISCFWSFPCIASMRTFNNDDTLSSSIGKLLLRSFLRRNSLLRFLDRHWNSLRFFQKWVFNVNISLQNTWKKHFTLIFRIHPKMVTYLIPL